MINGGFDNPKMPDWLEKAIRLAFRQKNVEFIGGYRKLWEDMLNDR